VLDLGGLTAKAEAAPDRRDLLLYLASTLRLSAASAHAAPDASLIDIGILLDCPLKMFDSRLFEPSIFATLTANEKSTVCLLVFHAINWVRESVNSFSVDLANFGGILPVSLEFLVHLQRVLQTCVKLHPSFSIPQTHPFLLPSMNLKKGCTFAACEKSFRPFRRPVLDLFVHGEEPEETTGDASKQLNEKADVVQMDLSNDTDEQPSSSTRVPKQSSTLIPVLNSSVLCILLQELSSQISSSLKELVYETAHDFQMQSGDDQELAIGKSFRSLIEPLASLLVHIDRADKEWISYETLMNDRESSRDQIIEEEGSASPEPLPVFDEAHLNVVRLGLDCLSSVFSCATLFQPEFSTVRKQLWIAFANFSPKTITKAGLYRCVQTLFHVVRSLRSRLASAEVAQSVAILLDHLLTHLRKLVSPERYASLPKRLSIICSGCLSVAWPTTPKKSTLTVFLQMYIRHSSSPLKTIERYVTRILPESSLIRAKQEATEDESGLGESSSAAGTETEPLPDHPTLSLHTLPVFFMVLLCELNENLAQQRAILQEAETTLELQEEATHAVGQCVMLFHGLIALTRVVNRTQISGTALRHGRVFVEELVRLIPVLNQSVQLRKTILPILTNVQRSTRILQVLCLHGKQNETKLAPLVPPIKRAMETLIYKVKAMMVNEELGDAFSIHVLANRNLAGETIPEMDDEDDDDDANDNDEEHTDGDDDDDE